MSNEPTNKNLLEYMAETREETQTGFNNVDKSFDKVENKLENIEDRLQIVESKIDKALYGEIDRHERWIRKIAEKVGVDLER